MLKPQTMLGNRYEILDQIGTGGMSDVYSAKDHSLNREVAVKVLKDEFATDTQFVSKFRAEAQAAAGLEHPNIVNIYDVGSENGLHYIVMEKIEGITLKTYIAKKGQLSYNEVISIAIQVGKGIEAAHNKGIVHRDIKPQNIMISKEGKVKVTDFGIAKAASSNTLNADPMGSVHYSSPEQVRGGFSNFQSDLYSLGIVMYEMCTGRVPFDGDTAVSVAIQHLQSEMQPPSVYAPNLPISVEKIIKKCTMKSPDRRYESMEELLIDLKKALVTPDEDFVNISEPNEGERTKIISEDELAKIRENTVEKEEPEPVYQEEEEDEDDDDDDSEINPTLDRAFNIMGIAAAVVILGIFVFLILSFFGVFRTGSGCSLPSSNDTNKEEVSSESSESEKSVEMIDVLGMTESEAKDALNDLGLGYKNIGTESSDQYDEGQICSQNVNAGEMVTANTTIKVKVSSGAGEISIPNVVGQTESAATSMLEDEGFDVSKEYEYSDEVEQGTVISQSPGGGSSGKEGDTVTIMVSQGQEQIKVPSVEGQDEASARSALESAGFSVTTEQQNSSTVGEGNVISQSLAAGTYANRGDAVNLVISAGPEEVKYSFSQTVNVRDDAETTTYMLTDAEGQFVSSWEVSSEKTISASDISTSTGTLSWTSTVVDEEGNPTTTEGSQAVTFTKQ